MVADIRTTYRVRETIRTDKMMVIIITEMKYFYNSRLVFCFNNFQNFN